MYSFIIYCNQPKMHVTQVAMTIDKALPHMLQNISSIAFSIIESIFYLLPSSLKAPSTSTYFILPPRKIVKISDRLMTSQGMSQV